MLHITNKVWTHWKGLDAPHNKVWTHWKGLDALSYKQIKYGLTGKDLMLRITNN